MSHPDTMLKSLYIVILKACSNGHDSSITHLSCSLDMFKFDMIVHDSFFRLTKRMIVHDSFSVSGGNQGGLNAIGGFQCHAIPNRSK